jgi:EpsI family protein
MTARLAAITSTLLFGLALARVATVERVLPKPTALADLPSNLGRWRSTADHRFDPGTLAILRADDYVGRTYVRRTDVADLFVGYYASQRQGQTIHSPLNCLPGAGWEPLRGQRMQIDVGSAVPIDANRYVIQKGLQQQLVLYWYQSHGRTVASEYTAKEYLVLDSIRLGRSDAALVRIVSPIGRDEAATEQSALDFVRALQPVLTNYLPG